MLWLVRSDMCTWDQNQTALVANNWKWMKVLLQMRSDYAPWSFIEWLKTLWVVKSDCIRTYCCAGVKPKRCFWLIRSDCTPKHHHKPHPANTQREQFILWPALGLLLPCHLKVTVYISWRIFAGRCLSEMSFGDIPRSSFLVECSSENNIDTFWIKTTYFKILEKANDD